MGGWLPWCVGEWANWCLGVLVQFHLPPPPDPPVAKQKPCAAPMEGDILPKTLMSIGQAFKTLETPWPSSKCNVR